MAGVSMANRQSKIQNQKSRGPVETFPNRHPGRDYEIKITAPEFTAVCPRTGQPDFATLTLTYVPDKACLELKSLKLYLQSYRNRGIFHEDVTNQILDDLAASCRPRRMTLVGEFNVRGGIYTTVTVTYPAKRTRATG
jgi:7-cyano-7-deazaguanine reductase